MRTPGAAYTTHAKAFKKSFCSQNIGGPPLNSNAVGEEGKEVQVSSTKARTEAAQEGAIARQSRAHIKQGITARQSRRCKTRQSRSKAVKEVQEKHSTARQSRASIK
eukprot:scaffold30256_cov20-Tisochrysis_lutea.AAC.3